MGTIEQLQQLSNWRKGAIGLLTLLWIGFTGTTLANLDFPWYGFTAVLALLWLGYLAVVYAVTKWFDDIY